MHLFPTWLSTCFDRETMAGTVFGKGGSSVARTERERSDVEAPRSSRGLKHKDDADQKVQTDQTHSSSIFAIEAGCYAQPPPQNTAV
jgi:hypothetical protein